MIQPGSSVMSPKFPNATVLPRVANPRVRPFIILRYFVRFGINMAVLNYPG